jgi:Flp pilus assembly protein TadG
MKRYSATSARSRSKGVAIVEFIIVMPICLILIMATAEFGRAFMQYNTLTKSVRDGVRYVASNALMGSTGVVSINGTVQTQARNLVVYGNTAGTGTAILPGLNTGAVVVGSPGGGNVSLSVTYPYGAIFVFVPGFFYGGNTATNGYNLQAAMTMRAL